MGASNKNLGIGRAKNRAASLTTGNVFWVDSGADLAVDDTAHGDSSERPFATLDFAVGQCTASNGDVIYVMAGHNEALTAADGVDVDVAGVHIIGQGIGSNKPQFDYDGANGEFVIGAAGVKLENLRFRASLNVVVNAINIETAGDEFHILNCDFVDEGDNDGTDEFNDAITVDVGADRGIIEGCYFDARAAGAVSAIELNGAVVQITIKDNTFMGDYSTACIRGDSTASQQVLIQNNLLWNGVHGGINAVAAISLQAGTTGVIEGNRIVADLTSPNLAIVADTCLLFDNDYNENAGVALGGNADFNPILGYRVQAADQNSPQNATTTLWTITGGYVMITKIVGQVGTVIEAIANLWNIRHVPTIGTLTVLGSDLDMTGFNAGSLINVQCDGTALISVDGTSTLLNITTEPSNVACIVDVGTIGWECGESATGTAKWDMWYWPIEDGSHVV